MSILNLVGVSSGYGKKQVLHDISLDIQEGETLLIVGSNGSGKSTLLKVIYGLLDVWNGTVEFEGKLLHNQIYKTSTHKLINKGIMYIPQKDALFDDLSVEENLHFSLLHINDESEINNRVKKILTEMPNLAERKKQQAGNLSGGERKLLSLAMAMVNRPKLLLYDEPLAGVSEENIPMVMRWLNEVRKKTTIVIVEHRIRVLLNSIDSVIGLKLGKIYRDELDNIDNIKNFML